MFLYYSSNTSQGWQSQPKTSSQNFINFQTSNSRSCASLYTVLLYLKVNNSLHADATIHAPSNSTTAAGGCFYKNLSQRSCFRHVLFSKWLECLQIMRHDLCASVEMDVFELVFDCYGRSAMICTSRVPYCAHL